LAQYAARGRVVGAVVLVLTRGSNAPATALLSALTRVLEWNDKSDREPTRTLHLKGA
jgi:hypothetical protein